MGVATLALAAACSGGDDTPGDEADSAESADAVVFPGDEWSRGEAEELGFDPAALEAVAARAEEAGSNCLVVVRDGEIAGEWYWNGTDASTPQEVFSVTKSITSTLVGIAEAEGHLDIDDPAAEYIDAWAGTPSEAVTVRNLLSNDSGRQWSAAIDYGQLPGQVDMDTFATGLGQDAPPGETWAYNNAAIQTLDVVVREATGEDTHAYAADRLFAPVGMDDSEMTTDASGNTRTFMGLQSTCEDLARFGYLFLRGGEWDGTQVVPGDWVEAAVGQPSQELTSAYGFLWWLNRPGRMADPAQATGAGEGGDDGDEQSQMVPGAPEDMFFALGLGDQIVAVDPGSETVVVRLGPFGVPEGAEPFGPGDAASVVTEALVEEDR